MSFLARSSLRTASRVQLYAPRAFSTSFVAYKGPVETVKDTVKTADRVVSDKIVEGIELGEKASAKAKQAAGIAAEEAKDLGGSVKDKSESLKHEAIAKEKDAKSKM